VGIVERVTLKLDIDTDTKSLGKATGQLKAFERAAKSNDRSLKDMGRGLDRTNRRMSSLGRTFRRVGMIATKFISVFTKFSFIAYAGQVAVLTTALLGAKLAMATGRVAANGYSIALRGVASAAVAAATAVAIAAASMRQFQEAQLSPFTGGLKGAAMANRSVSPMLRGLMGSEVTQQALRGLAKSGVHVSQQNAVLSELFNVTGGDSKQMTSLIGAISGDPGTFKEAVGKAAGGATAANRAGDLQGQQLIQLLASGGLTSGTGFAGLQNVMGATVIGTLKTEMQSLLSVFADVGEGLLGPTRDTIRLLGSTLNVFAQRSIPLIMKFGDMVLGSQGLASGMQKMSNSLFRLMKNTLPTLEGFVGRMSDMASSTRMFFRSMGNALRPLESGAEVLMSVFGEIFGGMGGNGVLDRFNRALTQNADSFIAFGESIGNVFEAFFAGSGGSSMVSFADRMTEAFNQFADDVVPELKSFANSMKELFVSALPPLFSTLSNIMAMINPIFQTVQRVGNAAPSLPVIGDDYGNLLLLAAMFGGKTRFSRMGRHSAALRANTAALTGAQAARAGIGTGRIGQFLAPGNVGGRDFLRTLGLNRTSSLTGGRVLPVGAGATAVGVGTLAAGGLGAMAAIDAISDANKGDDSAGNAIKGMLGGAGVGFAVGGVPGALIGAGISTFATLATLKRAQGRQTKNLDNFVIERLSDSALTAEERLANFTYAMENFEEVAQRNDMRADELKGALENLEPIFDELSREIEDKVASRVSLLTDVFGYSADEADQLARSLNSIDWNNLNAANFNALALDATGAFGYATLFAGTTANKNMLQATQAGLESSIFSQFGGDLDVAAGTEEGRRIIEALFNNIFTQSMLQEGQNARGAEFTALTMLERIFGPSQFTEDLFKRNQDLLSENQTISNLIGEGNRTLEDIAAILSNTFGGPAEAQLRAELGTKFDVEKAGNMMGGSGAYQAYLQARETDINSNIGTAMANLLSIETPVSVEVGVSGVIDPNSLRKIVSIVRKQAKVAGENIIDEIEDDHDKYSFYEDNIYDAFEENTGDFIEFELGEE
jgi:hypothetical protein